MPATSKRSAADYLPAKMTLSSISSGKSGQEAAAQEAGAERGRCLPGVAGGGDLHGAAGVDRHPGSDRGTVAAGNVLSHHSAAWRDHRERPGSGAARHLSSVGHSASADIRGQAQDERGVCGRLAPGGGPPQGQIISAASH